jgi:hypothetical protein
MQDKATRIVTAYETLGLNIEEISEQLDIDYDDVKVQLWENSKSYRNSLQNDSDTSEDKYQELLRMYETLARNSDVDSVREKALRNLINEYRGRNDLGLKELELKKKHLKVEEVDMSMRIAQFNAQMAQTRSVISKTLENVS